MGLLGMNGEPEPLIVPAKRCSRPVEPTSNTRPGASSELDAIGTAAAGGGGQRTVGQLKAQASIVTASALSAPHQTAPRAGRY